MWRSCAGKLSEQSDLFRLTFALEKAKDRNWHYRLLSDREWSGRYAVPVKDGINAIYLSRTLLTVSFNDEGIQLHPLPLRLTGERDEFRQILEECGWSLARTSDTDGFTLRACGQ